MTTTPVFLTRGDLDTRLRDSSADALGLAPTCHPRAGLDVVYVGQAQVHLSCHRCHQVFITLAMAEALPPNRWTRHEEDHTPCP